MLYTVKFEGKKYVYDSTSGAVLAIDTLQFKMLNAMTPPISPASLTALRYELAKYDSCDVSDTFDGIYALSQNGILYAPEDGRIRLRAKGEFACENEALAAKLLELAFADATDPIFEGDDFAELAKQAAERK